MPSVAESSSLLWELLLKPLGPWSDWALEHGTSSGHTTSAISCKLGYQTYQVKRVAQKKFLITWDLDLSEVKVWVIPPGKQPKPAQVLAEEEGALERVGEKEDDGQAS